MSQKRLESGQSGCARIPAKIFTGRIQHEEELLQLLQYFMRIKAQNLSIAAQQGVCCCITITLPFRP